MSNTLEDLIRPMFAAIQWHGGVPDPIPESVHFSMRLGPCHIRYFHDRRQIVMFTSRTSCIWPLRDLLQRAESVSEVVGQFLMYLSDPDCWTPAEVAMYPDVAEHFWEKP